MTLAAAASVRSLVGELASDYRKAHDIPITLTSGSTGELARQVRHGAGVDVFFGADLATAESLSADGFAEGSVVVYARGELVLWQRADAQPRLKSLRDLLNEDVTLAMANPEMAPYGAAARAVLSREGLWEAVEARIVYANNVEQALQFADTGNVTAAFLSRSLIVHKGPFLTLGGPEAQVVHGAIVVKHPTGSHPHAVAFLELVASPTAHAILEEHGFTSVTVTP
jgi:molybdate transport system substrate-binding protein